jgi:hypothetical protein
MKQYLRPIIEDVRMECVLVQAWKKASSYLRSHSWYADTLSIDYNSLRLPQFLKEIQERLQQPDKWVSATIDMVPAPKNQRWVYREEKWEPNEKNIDLKLRPLAHLDLSDQVVATAIMLCLADRLETATGDPRLPIEEPGNRQKILAYGHRLICDLDSNDDLRHRWGSTKLYRQYFTDYQTFLRRPKVVVRELVEKTGPNQDETFELAIVQSDLSKFYDRVRPTLLRNKLRKLQRSTAEEQFFVLAEQVFRWLWSNSNRAKAYGQDHGIDGFECVALPQGLVTAGFFANVILHDLDTTLRESIGSELDGTELVLQDICYYVDDFRIVLKIPRGTSEEFVKENTVSWLQGLLDEHAPGTKVSGDKTEVTVEGREKRFLVEQSREANRIQRQVSDTFDMIHGTDLIAAIEGFFHTQQRYSVELSSEITKESGLLVGVPDMRDDTAARFAAGRFRRTYRSLRPLLPDKSERVSEGLISGGEKEEPPLPDGLVLTKEELDQRARFFSALLIEEWVKNPGHVRLLRIALDLFPDGEYLDQVLKILSPAWKTSCRGARREVRTYCLAELFRAGATETGFISEHECLPSSVSIEAYRARLVREAREILMAYLDAEAPGARLPWYLMQQVFLYLASQNNIPHDLVRRNAKGGKLLSQYWSFAQFLAGKPTLSLEQRSIFSVIARTGYGISDFGFLRSMLRLSADFLKQVDRIAPNVARELWLHFREDAAEILTATARHIGLEDNVPRLCENSLADICAESINPFYEEENLLELANWLFLNADSLKTGSTPWNLGCSVTQAAGYEFGKIKVEAFTWLKVGGKAQHLFNPPDWCETDEDRQKYRIGLLLRYALRGSTDFYYNSSSTGGRHGPRYGKSISHWEQQRYSSFQGRKAFGPPWLPISSFAENLLFQLLRWPGSGLSNPAVSVKELSRQVEARLLYLRDQRGDVTSATFLDQTASYPSAEPEGPWTRPLRIGIVQSILPTAEDFLAHATDPQLLNDSAFRRRQRAHLASIMEGVSQLLRVRDTHRLQYRADERTIDLLVFPELSIHPQDIIPLILPFVRKHKCISLFGQVYHLRDSSPDAPLINSCLWMIPEWNRAEGFQVRFVEQGKKNIMRLESGLTPAPVGFRPAQWLIRYQWHSDIQHHRPLVLSASVCYDATDLKLAADLRSRADLYVVCALNQDVGTFDRMSEGLHYHMFQGVMVVNNGEYGGSSFYLPFQEEFFRQVFHVHGQPQVSIAFVEVSPEKLINRPASHDGDSPRGKWKTPPAGWHPIGP